MSSKNSAKELEEKLIEAFKQGWRIDPHALKAQEKGEDSFIADNAEKYESLGEVGEVEPAVAKAFTYSPEILGYHAYFLGGKIKEGEPLTQLVRYPADYHKDSREELVTDPRDKSKVYFESKSDARGAVDTKLQQTITDRGINIATTEYDFHQVPVDEMSDFLQNDLEGEIESKERVGDHYEIIERY